MDWAVIIGVIGTLVGWSAAYFKSRKDSRLDSFRAIMEESKTFREEFRRELTEAKAEVASLKKEISQWKARVDELSQKLREALLPRSWLYYYLQKPIRHTEIEPIIKRYIENPTDCVLVIEDDPYTQKVLAMIAATNNWNIVCTSTGKSALEMIKITPPKLIIIDLVMPVADSFDVLNTIHESRELSNIPFIVIASNSLKEVDRIYFHTKINESLAKA